MNFYESMIYGFFEKMRQATAPTPEQVMFLMVGLMDSAACRALEEIRNVLKDDSLDDANCFMRIEKIVQIYEEIGSDGGERHDFQAQNCKFIQFSGVIFFALPLAFRRRICYTEPTLAVRRS
ncbi:hypothetical protein [uncultured Oscillibacter sp.]|uniref:hypothetical protein n=1 Tax=uncultured Oscillibacter sp. TaxID=876091 RepID=UPI00261D364F|nr:hypothetical protein [uncultured Oscillibacter sp.]